MADPQSQTKKAAQDKRLEEFRKAVPATNAPDDADKEFEIVYDRENCIGAGACVALASDVWEMNADGKADCKQMCFGKADFKKNFEAAESCPVTVIHIVGKKTGKRYI